MPVFDDLPFPEAADARCRAACHGPAPLIAFPVPARWPWGTPHPWWNRLPPDAKAVCGIFARQGCHPGFQLPIRHPVIRVVRPLRGDLAEVRWAQGRKCSLKLLRLRLEVKEPLE